MTIQSAVAYLMSAPRTCYMTRDGIEGGVFYETGAEPFSYKRYPRGGVISRPWTPNAIDLLCISWRVEDSAK